MDKKKWRNVVAFHPSPNPYILRFKIKKRTCKENGFSRPQWTYIEIVFLDISIAHVTVMSRCHKLTVFAQKSARRT